MAQNGKLIYGGWLVRRWDGAPNSVIEGGALYEEGGRIRAVGTLAELDQRFPGATRIGDRRHIVMPGLVNAHSHGRGLTTYQMGRPDSPLELRIVEMFDLPEWAAGEADPRAQSNAAYDPYLDTTYSCLKQIASGITTTVHSHQYVEGSVEQYGERTRKVVEAYRDVGIRCAFTVGMRDRSSFPFAEDAAFMAALPPELRTPSASQDDYGMGYADYCTLLRALAADYPTITFQLGPWNPVFCSDELLGQIADTSRSEGWRIQTHLCETQYQAAHARKRYGKTWAAYLAEIGMLSERFSGAHGVWLERDDIAIVRQAGAQLVHNPSSNMRLQSGIAPLRDFLAGGLDVAFGLDSLGMNDDEDILQDLRLGRMVQSAPGIDGATIPAAAMLTMATRAGAKVAGIAGIGALDEGNWADVVLLSRPDMEGVPAGHPVAELLLRRASARHIRTVMIGGRVMIEDGRWKDHDPARTLAALAGPFEPTPTPSRLTERLKGAVGEYLRIGR